MLDELHARCNSLFPILRAGTCPSDVMAGDDAPMDKKNSPLNDCSWAHDVSGHVFLYLCHFLSVDREWRVSVHSYSCRRSVNNGSRPANAHLHIARYRTPRCIILALVVLVSVAYMYWMFSVSSRYFLFRCCFAVSSPPTWFWTHRTGIPPGCWRRTCLAESAAPSGCGWF